MRETVFVLRLRDRPGALELVAATFAHRGVSIRMTLANDSDDDPEGLATVLLTFRATPTRKDALRASLSRLSRVVSVEERTGDEPSLRQAAVVRVSGAALDAPGVHVETLATDTDRGERTVALFGPPAQVEALLVALREEGRLRAVTHATLGL